jgi:hypothetical protein
VNRDLRALIRAHDGLLSRTDALAAIPDHVLDHAIAAGQLLRLFPRVYADPARAGEPLTRVRAALRYAGPDAALSHVTALAVWELPGGTWGSPAHVVVPGGRRRCARSGVVVHRRRGFAVTGPGVVVRSGLATCRVEQAVVDSWTVLPGDTRRAAVIAAVGARRTTPERLLGVVGRRLNLPDRRELLRLLNLLVLGCRSELELWGYDHVFTGPDVPRIERNVPVRFGNRTIYMDAYCPEARVNFELDGAKYHTSRRDRERDARRDAALAAMGIMVVRFTHSQLTQAPALVRAQIRAIVAARLAG